MSNIQLASTFRNFVIYLLTTLILYHLGLYFGNEKLTKVFIWTFAGSSL